MSSDKICNAPHPTIKESIGFIGGGNMAKAICSGIINKGMAQYSQIYVSSPHIENLGWWIQNGATASIENVKILEKAQIIFLSVKPHILPLAVASMLKTLPANFTEPRLFVSILAGVTLDQLSKTLRPVGDNVRLIRVMPNTPVMVGEGCAALCAGNGATAHDVKTITSIFSVSGICKEVPESMINSIGALSGSGPAFIYLVIEALADAGVKQGIPRAMAIEMAAQTTLGAAKMVLSTDKHTAVLRDEVCSPGGTTICGVHELESGGVRAAMFNAVEAAAKKSALLGQQQQPK
ncbi:pyrroline-5-carboxylate reductase 3-like [Anthonomus grandis grandis]|uniref:pyrroline-5-carboxylate reductase 3-like n=1 Tax=Anthonomus grandis grandis TaxID=2921223 RepID=UPI002165EA6E|nr:pyrroline-5-carboxylate reductase 3-like [Anthonomus grandis grandis]